MNFDYSAYTYRTNHRPTNHYSHFNEDVHCDNEVNLILEKNCKQSTTEQSNEILGTKENSSFVVNQTNPYYFVPIREQTVTTTLAENHVIDCSSSISDLHRPSTLNLLDESSSENYCSSFISTMNSSSDTATVNSLNQTNYSLNDMDLAALFVSSLVTSTPSPTTVPSSTIFDQLVHNDTGLNDNQETSSNTFDDVFSNQVTDLDFDATSPFIDSQQTIGPPPGFENFRFDSSLSNGLILPTTTNNPANSSTTNASAESAVSSDTINFSQLLSSTEVDLTQLQQAPISARVGSIRSSSSSHPSFPSDEQSIFFPTKNNPYSPSNSILHTSSQIFSKTTPPAISTTNATSSVANPHIPNGLSFNNHYPGQVSSSSSSSLSRMPSSANDSPLPKTNFDTDTKLIDGESTNNRIFTSNNSFFTNGHTDFNPLKGMSRQNSSVNPVSSVTVRTSSSSSTSSSDDAFLQLAQNQKQQLVHMNQLFNDESNSIFNFNALAANTNMDNEQQQAVHENISFLASMASASTPVTSDMPWSLSDNFHSTNSNPIAVNKNSQRKQVNNNIFQRQSSHKSSTTLPHLTTPNPLVLNELVENLNECCYKGFDDLHTLIQEQRCVQSTLNLNSTSMSSTNSPILALNGSNSGSSRVLVVPEYFIFKCKKVETVASHIFEIFLNKRPEYRLRDRLGTFKSWKEAILNAESIHKEEENKLRLSTDHPHSYYMTDAVLKSTFDRVHSSIRILATLTQQVGQIFQLIVLQTSQPTTRHSISEPIANAQQSSGSMTVQTKPFFIRNSNGSVRSTP